MRKPYRPRKPDPTPRPTPARLRELLAYDATTGELTWKQFRPGVRPGDEAGTLTGTGHIMLTVDGRKLAASQAIWAMTTDAYPTRRLRFIDNNPSNLIYGNLTDAPDFDRYEDDLLAQGMSPSRASDAARNRAHRTMSQTLLRVVNAAAMRAMEHDPHAAREYATGDRRTRKHILEHFRNKLRQAYPEVYPSAHIQPQGRPRKRAMTEK